ncbi:MAG TPA: hypothetical protein VHY34_12225 [Caulobacteraceae bacterium]|jgi:hypothetical protein|nr:hypothetical protein [Caulobacteraceae bacterium]
MIQAIRVTPSADGWTVRSDAVDHEMFFRSGASAEAAARALGERMAGTGANVEIEIFLRDGSLAGRFAYPPD